MIEPLLLEHSVFVVFASDNTDVQRILRAKGVRMSEDGTRGLLWRPFHLVGVETPHSVAQAALFGVGTATPPPTPTVEVVAIAKRDLAEGVVLGGMGDGQVRGEAYPASAVRVAPATLPRGAGLTHEALAERAGLCARGISDLERGVSRVPRAETVALLADALGLAVAWRDWRGWLR